MIAKKLEGLRDDKAGGADEITPRYLNKIKDEISYPLTIIFNNVLEEEKVHEDWKEAYVIPLYKGGSKSSVSNYIPVSLTLQICKLFEAIVKDNMVEFLDT